MEKRPLRKGKGIAMMEQQVRDRLRDCGEHINENYDVDGLCRALLTRLQGAFSAKVAAANARTWSRPLKFFGSGQYLMELAVKALALQRQTCRHGPNWTGRR